LITGNIDVDLFSEEQLMKLEMLLQNVEEAGYDGGYCVGSGNSIPEYVKLENYIAMINS
jgi:uroporphyrinogen decarboxylase